MAGAKLSFTLPDMAIQEIVPHHTQEIAPGHRILSCVEFRRSSVYELARDLTRASSTGYFLPSEPVQQHGEGRQPGLGLR